MVSPCPRLTWRSPVVAPVGHLYYCNTFSQMSPASPFLRHHIATLLRSMRESVTLRVFRCPQLVVDVVGQQLAGGEHGDQWNHVPRRALRSQSAYSDLERRSQFGKPVMLKNNMCEQKEFPWGLLSCVWHQIGARITWFSYFKEWNNFQNQFYW